MFLHVDLEARRVCPFPPDMHERVAEAAAAHAGLPLSGMVGPAHRDARTLRPAARRRTEPGVRSFLRGKIAL